MSNQLKGGSYQITKQGDAVQKAGTTPAQKDAGQAKVHKPVEKAPAKTITATKGKTT